MIRFSISPLKKLYILTFLLLCFFSWAFLSEALEVGNPVRDFALEATDGKEIRLSDFRNDIVLLIFWSATCPITKAYEYRIQNIYDEFVLKGVQILGIDPNPDESVDQIQSALANRKIPFPVLLDPEAHTADYFSAEKTPEVFVIDRGGRLAYQGAIDNETWANHNPTVPYLRNALFALLNGEKPPEVKTKPYGCKIKRKAPDGQKKFIFW